MDHEDVSAWASSSLLILLADQATKSPELDAIAAELDRRIPVPDPRIGGADGAMVPCPFCGAVDRLRVESHPDRDLGSPCVTLACVRCRACGCAGPAERGGPGTQTEAIANWNRRPGPR